MDGCEGVDDGAVCVRCLRGKGYQAMVWCVCGDAMLYCGVVLDAEIR